MHDIDILCEWARIVFYQRKVSNCLFPRLDHSTIKLEVGGIICHLGLSWREKVNNMQRLWGEGCDGYSQNNAITVH